MTNELADSAVRLLAPFSAQGVFAGDAWSQDVWDAIEAAGFCAAMLPEHAGGFGATMQDAMALLRVAAAHATPLPLAETMLAGWLLAQAGLPVPPGPLTPAPVRNADRITARPVGGSWQIAGSVRRVPWGRQARMVVIAHAPTGPKVAIVDPSEAEIVHGANLAGEPRDTLSFEVTRSSVAALPPGFDVATLRAAGAAIRANQIAGALSRVLEITLDHVQTRVQFGRPIGKFQAVQHAMAQLAGQSAAAIASADIAADELAGPMRPEVIGASKARAGEAAGLAAGLAHQAHGAIGFTQEYRLQRLTRRLWSWRDEFGNEAEWQILLGRAVAAAGADGLWPMIAAA